MMGDRVLLGNECSAVGGWDSKNVFPAVLRDNVVFVLRVERAKGRELSPDEVGDLLKVHLAPDVDRVRKFGQGAGCGLDSEFGVVMERIEGANHRGDVVARLGREIRVDRPVIGLALGVSYGLTDIAIAAVVGADRQGPVAEHAVGVAKVAGCRIRGLDYIHSLVYERVDLEPEVAPGRVHELPHSLRPHLRGRARVQVRFDYRERAEFERDIVAVEGLLDHGHIVVAEPEDTAHFLAILLRIADDEPADYLVVRQVQGRSHGLEPLHIDFVCLAAREGRVIRERIELRKAFFQFVARHPLVYLARRPRAAEFFDPRRSMPQKDRVVLRKINGIPSGERVLKGRDALLQLGILLFELLAGDPAGLRVPGISWRQGGEDENGCECFLHLLSVAEASGEEDYTGAGFGNQIKEGMIGVEDGVVHRHR